MSSRSKRSGARAITWAEPIVNTIPKMLRKMAIPRDNAWLRIQWVFLFAKKSRLVNRVFCSSSKKNGQKNYQNVTRQVKVLLFWKKDRIVSLLLLCLHANLFFWKKIEAKQSQEFQCVPWYYLFKNCWKLNWIFWKLNQSTKRN